MGGTPTPAKKRKLDEELCYGGGGASTEPEQLLVSRIAYLTLLVENRRKELDNAERSLSDAKAELARRRSATSSSSPPCSVVDGACLKDPESSSSSSRRHHDDDEYYDGVKIFRPVVAAAANLRPVLRVPARRSQGTVPVPPVKIKPPAKMEVDAQKQSAAMKGKRTPRPSSVRSNASEKTKSQMDGEANGISIKENFVETSHEDLISSVRKSSSGCLVKFQQASSISSGHTKRPRTLSSCPVNDHIFTTSALDGLVKVWQVQPEGAGVKLLSTTDCASPIIKRWPEDLAWHPDGDSLFAAYSADGDSLISVLNLNDRSNNNVRFLYDKPHLKGGINSINFMPWKDTCFVTGGNDHAVVLWKETSGGGSWKPTKVHDHFHSSAVMGVAGIRGGNVILSAGLDKRIVAYDVDAAMLEFNNRIEDKCLSVLPNPCDSNLFMVQSRAHGKQLRLFDSRSPQSELHSFGWKQESSDSQSSLIKQAWSPDGWRISSGSADPAIHIFDIRYIGDAPAQSLRSHHERAFKAIWLRAENQLLASISTDRKIVMHKL